MTTAAAVTSTYQACVAKDACICLELWNSMENQAHWSLTYDQTSMDTGSGDVF